MPTRLHGGTTLPTVKRDPWVSRRFLPHPQLGRHIPPGPRRQPSRSPFPLLSLSRPFFTFSLKQKPSRTHRCRPLDLATRPCLPPSSTPLLAAPLPLLSVLALSQLLPPGLQDWTHAGPCWHTLSPGSTSFRARLRRRFFRETVLSQGEPSRPPRLRLPGTLDVPSPGRHRLHRSIPASWVVMCPLDPELPEGSDGADSPLNPI